MGRRALVRNVKVIAAAGMLLVVLGCSTWQYPKLADISAPAHAPEAATCADCHSDQFAGWQRNKHSNSHKMACVPIESFRGCGACHDKLTEHQNDPGNVNPTHILALSKVEQNKICGKCHFDRSVLGKKAINPHNRHGLFMNCGFDGNGDTLSCLECHSGHSGKADMLKNIRANVCFRCHKEAIVTMGVFQPINYLTAGHLCLTCHSVHGGTAGHQAVRLAAGSLAVCFVCHPTGNPSRLGFGSGHSGKPGGQ